jgi:hypothetical protein
MEALHTLFCSVHSTVVPSLLTLSLPLLCLPSAAEAHLAVSSSSSSFRVCSGDQARTRPCCVHYSILHPGEMHLELHEQSNAKLANCSMPRANGRAYHRHGNLQPQGPMCHDPSWAPGNISCVCKIPVLDQPRCTHQSRRSRGVGGEFLPCDLTLGITWILWNFFQTLQ